jgi:hypothetical protein
MTSFMSGILSTPALFGTEAAPSVTTFPLAVETVATT